MPVTLYDDSIVDKSFSSVHQNAQEILTHILANSLSGVDGVINDHLKSDIALIEKISKHIIYAGGKRIRPSLTLASAQLFGPIPPSAIYLAAAVEFIHTATLLHDDVIDESNLRRGKPSAHQVWGNSASILVGDFLFARAFELMVKTKNLSVLEILSHASATIAEGEVQQLVEAHNLGISQETALKILGAKTAQLFGAACQTGAIVAGASQQDAGRLFNYGYNLGLVFQITDDVLDYTAQNSTRGKIVGDDFREGKVTLPVIFAHQKATSDEKQFMERTLIQLDQNPEDFGCMLALIQKYDAIKDSLKVGVHFQEQALRALEGINVPPSSVIEGEIAFSMKDTLMNIVRECLVRES